MDVYSTGYGRMRSMTKNYPSWVLAISLYTLNAGRLTAVSAGSSLDGATKFKPRCGDAYCFCDCPSVHPCRKDLLDNSGVGESNLSTTGVACWWWCRLVPAGHPSSSYMGTRGAIVLMTCASLRALELTFVVQSQRRVVHDCCIASFSPHTSPSAVGAQRTMFIDL